MPSPFRVFFWITFAFTLVGLLIGTLNLHNPEAVHIPFGPDGESAEGIDGLIAAILSSLVLGLLIGGLAAFLAWATNAGVKRGRKALYPDEQEFKNDG